MNAATNLFKTQLEGETLAAALELREHSKRLGDEVKPLIEQHEALLKQAAELEAQIDAKHEAFDTARVAFFEGLEASLSIDLDATSLEYADNGSVYIQRTNEDVARKVALESLQGGNPLAALMGALALGRSEDASLDLENLEACNNPDCQACGPLRSVH